MGASRKEVPFQGSLEIKQLVLTALGFFFFSFLAVSND